MQYLLTFCFIAAAVNAASISPPSAVSYEVTPYELRQFDTIFGSARNIIQNLVEKLRIAASEATEAIGVFSTRIQTDARNVREKIAGDIQKMRDRVSTTIDNVANKLIDSGVGVVGCVATSREEAALLFNQTLTKSLQCIDNRIKEASTQLGGLSDIASSATGYGDKLLEDMRQCTAQNGNVLSIGACLGNVAVHAEMEVAVFATQTALSIGRVSLTLATLPAWLEVCAGARLVEVGTETSKIVMEIGTCSANSVYTSMTAPAYEANSSLTSDTGPLTPNIESLVALPSEKPIILK